MDTVIKKDELLAILTDNRAKHRDVFLAAFEGFQAMAEERLVEYLAAMHHGKKQKRVSILLEAPEDHTRDYDRVIRMLELDVRDEITLTESEIAQYIMDDWRWKRAWLSMSNRYASASTQEAYGAVEDDDDI